MTPGRTILSAIDKPAMKRVLLSFAILALLFIAAIGAILVQDNTDYAPRFSEEKFRLIVPGMSQGTVDALIGPPLEVMVGPFPEAWVYKQARSLRSLFRFEPAARSYIVFVDGRVFESHGQAEVRAGMTPGEVIDHAGLPERIEACTYRRALFSRQRGDPLGRITVRAVRYDQAGRVVGIEAHWDFD